VAYLVRSLRTYARIRSLTTGTFNRIFKDRITFRLSGANSVRADSSENLTVLETLQTYRAAKNPVNARSAQNFHPFSTTGILSSAARGGNDLSAQRYGLPLSQRCQDPAQGFLGRARAEDRKLIKELALEVLALKVPFRKLAVALFLNSGLVAEANFLG
jgi:hypothetical protein